MINTNYVKIGKGEQINGNPEVKPSEKKCSAQIKAEFVKGIMDRINGDDFESEEERQAFENKIQQKIKNGAKLSAKEMAYIRRTNPYIYQQVVRVQQRREALKEQLRHCRTKEEAQQVMSNAMTSISDKDPARDAMIAAIQNVSQQFRDSEAYQKLPDTEEDLKKAKKSDSTMEDPFKEDAEEDDDSMVSYSFGLGGYQEAVTGEASFNAGA
ncbi:hypothetical protein SAMN04487884_1603 [Butyrivibrio fibrisolvens]|uniref:Uncharacterized protein n=1 Tax=Butyrivibrio fibrisolvens TaxID=831 RepID=A0A1H9XDC1_BUTFI|nr:hypothetical protein [Butyrivibrio fibrisolvens]SES44122.1 hypothetical protein SAMN04487884_1603 [Butyrivibrio fibrisolvens]